MHEHKHAPVSRTWETFRLQKINFWQEFVMNAFVASFSPLLIFREAIQ